MESSGYKEIPHTVGYYKKTITMNTVISQPECPYGFQWDDRMPEWSTVGSKEKEEISAQAAAEGSSPDVRAKIIAPAM